MLTSEHERPRDVATLERPYHLLLLAFPAAHTTTVVTGADAGLRRG